MSKPILLVLGDHKKTIRNRVSEFETFSSKFEVKVNQDLTRAAFEKALKEKKYKLNPHSYAPQLNFFLLDMETL